MEKKKYTIKPLEWVEKVHESRAVACGWQFAVIRAISTGQLYAYYGRCDGDSEDIFRVNSEEEGKAALEKIYTDRLLTALEEVV